MQKKTNAKSAAMILLSFTAPLILSGLFQQLFNWVDAFIVGNVEGETALAGIGPPPPSTICLSMSSRALLPGSRYYP